ncbi:MULTISPECIES: GNAT family protein [Helicobacter]|uniref:Periplasmic protein n=1 Tax=Helicobacter cinaedi CCUG 18818 = ATCC BAA-847 TaxID=537971 RepID=A0AAI8MMY3_9HELI|nr:MULTISPECIES: hypothetical protein [Helicobacter]EFR47742.1 hypothetical protein HCCG_02291 [Helicobacter cinaedi CCUG 18818 = ATCC BAA-847]BAM32675.1 hypothetical protein HCBAA847_1445 [Helicobacter cinaedi CCUG 18818 = ATCC BAA-847]STP07456.1 Uncharacterised protein [Helicobacter fennelliae]
MKTKLVYVLFMLFSSYAQLWANSLVLNPLSVDYLHLRDEFDFTQKGNVYEKKFRMPLDLWRDNLYVDIFISFGYADNLNYVKSNDLETLPIQNAKDFFNRLEIIKSPYNNKLNLSPNFWIPERKEKIMQLLKAYHPNQYFKFKITFIPLANPKAKQEQIIEFPLYFIGSKQKYITNMRVNVKTWKKYYVKLEVLEDTTLPNDIKPLVIIKSSSDK